MAALSHDVQIATAEAVALELEVAGPGHRILAWTLDAWIIFIGWSTLAFALSYLRTALGDVTRVFGLDAWIQVMIVFGVFVTNWCYGLLFESLASGQTPGKRLMGLRVVSDDGSPASFLEIAIRNFCRGIDFLPAFYAIGVTALVLSRRTQRLGDLVAGTLVVRVGGQGLALYDHAVFAPRSSGRPLLPQEQELVLLVLGRLDGLDPAPRAALAVKLAQRLGQGMPEEERGRLREPRMAEAFLRALARGEA